MAKGSVGRGCCKTNRVLEFLTKLFVYVPSVPIDGSIEMLKNSISKISIKKKIVKHFTSINFSLLLFGF